MKICFVTELPQISCGGAEIQCYLIALGLAEKGHEIHYVSYGVPEHIPKGISLHRILPKFNVDVAKRLAVLGPLKDADCDVYLQTCAGSMTGITGFFCEQYKKPFVYRAASAWDADLTFAKGKGWHTFSYLNKKAYVYGIKKANVIVCDAEKIQNLFDETSKEFGITKDIRLIKKGHIIPKEIFLDKQEPPFILWVARLMWYKHPEEFIRLAGKLSHYRFVLVGAGVYQLPKELPGNLECLGFKTGVELENLYANASLFINTCDVEGFSNTFIECGIFSVPYVGCVDPDNVIKTYNLGATCDNFRELCVKVENLMQDGELRKQMGINIRKYVEQHHNIKQTVDNYEKIFQDVKNKV